MSIICDVKGHPAKMVATEPSSSGKGSVGVYRCRECSIGIRLQLRLENGAWTDIKDIASPAAPLVKRLVYDSRYVSVGDDLEVKEINVYWGQE